MAASPAAMDTGTAKSSEKWNSVDNRALDNLAPSVDADASGGPSSDSAAPPTHDNPGYAQTSSVAGDGATNGTSSAKDDAYRGEKQVKLNKVYIGGLPEHTHKADLESCFGKIGTIVNIELKVGYGFVEFDTREAAEESVAKYHEGYFMGNKIRVELSHGGGRTAKYSGDPGACFKCGQIGHWARECPNHVSHGPPGRRPTHMDPPLIDRIQSSRDYPPRDYPPYREDYARYPPPRDVRYPYDYPPPLPRDYRRPPSPPSRDVFPPVPPVSSARSVRDYDDVRHRGGPPVPPPPSRYDSRRPYYPPDVDMAPPGYPSRGYPPPPPPPRDYYDRYERSGPPPDRFPPYPPPPSSRPRTPPGVLPRARDDFDRPSRDFPPPPDHRGRAPPSPPPSRYSDYTPRAGSSEAPSRYSRRRSQSPPPRSGSGAPYESSGYLPSSGSAPYNNVSSSNGFSSGGPPPARSSSSRDYPPRSSRDGDSGYRRP